MAFAMNSLAFRGAKPTAGGGARTRRAAASRPVAATAVSRRRAVEAKAFFNFFAPAKAAPSKPDPRALELVDEILSVAARAGSGSAPPPAAVAARVEELVEELAPYSVRNPTRSPLLWGAWEVAYCSLPTAVGGPLRKGPGPVIFPGQRARQILTEEDSSLVNEGERGEGGGGGGQEGACVCVGQTATANQQHAADCHNTPPLKPTKYTTTRHSHLQDARVPERPQPPVWRDPAAERRHVPGAHVTASSSSSSSPSDLLGAACSVFHAPLDPPVARPTS